MVLPLAGLFRAPAGWPRRVMTLYTAGLALVGAAAVAAFRFGSSANSDGSLPQFQTLASAFVFGVFIQGWIANALAGARVRK